MIKNNYWSYDFVEATQFMIDNCDEKIIAMYHITADDRVMGGINKAKKLTQTVQNSKYTTAEGEEIQRIYVSTLCPNDTETFDTSSYAYELATLSGGIAVTGYVANEDTEVMTAEVESIEVYANDEEGTKTSSNVKNNLTDILGEGMDLKDFKIISSAGLTEISLKTPLRINEYYTSKSKKPTDTDEDGLYDWDEVCINAIEAIKGDNIKDGILLPNNMPSLLECMTYYNKHGKGYVGKGFEKYMNENNSNPHHVLNSTCILPINSDPTSIDSDDDGFLDNAYVNNYENVDEKDKITYEWVKQSDKYFNVSDPNPLKKEIIWQWPAYYSDGTYINRLQSSFREGREGYEHNGIDITPKAGKKDNCKAIASYAGTIQLMKENSATAGNYIEIKHVINGKIYISRYLHLKEFNQSIYEQYTLGKTVNVNAGDIIGIIGDTASPGAVHLHYTLCKEKVDTKIDPLCFDIDVSGELITNPDLMFMKLPIGLRKTCDNRCDSCNKYFKKLETRYKLDETDWGDLN